jgi:outer membrane biogenesis lipoprotein LolB
VNRLCLAPVAVALLLNGCSSAAPEKITPDKPEQTQQERERCYQTSWWAETSAVIYRRFDEEHQPQPAQGENQPAAATEECP